MYKQESESFWNVNLGLDQDVDPNFDIDLDLRFDFNSTPRQFKFRIFSHAKNSKSTIRHWH